jgi:predicted nucleic acid-binding protein
LTYSDTSLLVAFYANENSALEAARLLAASGHPVPFNRILELELRNAIRRKVPRREITASQARRFLRQLESDVRQGILAWQTFDFEPVFDRAERLGAQFTERLNTRSIDILHVAIALDSDARRFIRSIGIKLYLHPRQVCTQIESTDSARDLTDTHFASLINERHESPRS